MTSSWEVLCHAFRPTACAHVAKLDVAVERLPILIPHIWVPWTLGVSLNAVGPSPRKLPGKVSRHVAEKVELLRYQAPCQDGLLGLKGSEQTFLCVGTSVLVLEHPSTSFGDIALELHCFREDGET